MAEGVGFGPTEPLSGFIGFQNRCLRPLGHPSAGMLGECTGGPRGRLLHGVRPPCTGDSAAVAADEEFPWYPRPLHRVHLEGWAYTLYVDPAAQAALLELPIPWHVVYSVWFWLTAEQARLFREDRAAFDRLADELAHDKGERRWARQLLRHEGPGPPRATTPPVRLPPEVVTALLHGAGPEPGPGTAHVPGPPPDGAAPP